MVSVRFSNRFRILPINHITLPVTLTSLFSVLNLVQFMTVLNEHLSSEVLSCVVLEKQEVGPTTVTASALISSIVFPLVPSATNIMAPLNSTNSLYYQHQYDWPILPAPL